MRPIMDLSNSGCLAISRVHPGVAECAHGNTLDVSRSELGGPCLHRALVLETEIGTDEVPRNDTSTSRGGHAARRTTRLRLRDRSLENPCLAPLASLDRLHHLDRIRRYFDGSKDLGWPRESGGARGGRPNGPHRRSFLASLQSPVSAVAPPFCQQHRRHPGPTHGWRVQEWPGRGL